MKNALVVSLLVALLAIPSGGNLVHAADDGVKQPIFLLCPHKERLSAWSLFLTVDKADPSKVVSLGLEKLKKQNSVDSSYEAVLAAQNDSKTEREVLGTLAAKDFSSSSLEVQKDDALKVSVSSAGEGAYRLMVSLRISADLRFTIGGKEQEKRDVVLKFDKSSKKWQAVVQKLKDAEGNNLDAAAGKPMSGIAFPVISTGIYRVLGVIEGIDPVVLLDR
jgi:hypothetical protein